MIDFRYHLVSIVAIFLALAIGIVLGTTALNGPVTEALQKGNDSLNADLNNLRAQNAALQQQVGAAGAFASDATPQLVAHLLDGRRVVLIDAPGASDQVQNGVAATLQKAGATITGQVQLQDKFFDTSATTLNYLDQLAQGVKPAGLTLTGGTPQQRAAQVLASAVVTKALPGIVGSADSASGAGGAGGSDSAAQAVLAGFAGGGFLTTSGKMATRATLAVVITPADPLTGPNSDPANQALTAVAAAVSSASAATVMAGPASSAQQGGAVAALRASPGAKQVSSVDDADEPFGQIVVAQVLATQMSTHSVGSYGEGPGANQVAPSPMPTASAAPSASVTPSARRSANPGGRA